MSDFETKCMVYENVKQHRIDACGTPQIISYQSLKLDPITEVIFNQMKLVLSRAYMLPI